MASPPGSSSSGIEISVDDGNGEAGVNLPTSLRIKVTTPLSTIITQIADDMGNLVNPQPGARQEFHPFTQHVRNNAPSSQVRAQGARENSFRFGAHHGRNHASSSQLSSGAASFHTSSSQNPRMTFYGYASDETCSRILHSQTLHKMETRNVMANLALDSNAWPPDYVVRVNEILLVYGESSQCEMAYLVGIIWEVREPDLIIRCPRCGEPMILLIPDVSYHPRLDFSMFPHHDITYHRSFFREFTPEILRDPLIGQEVSVRFTFNNLHEGHFDYPSNQEVDEAHIFQQLFTRSTTMSSLFDFAAAVHRGPKFILVFIPATGDPLSFSPGADAHYTLQEILELCGLFHVNHPLLVLHVQTL